MSTRAGKFCPRHTTDSSFPNLHSKLFFSALLLSQSSNLHFTNSKQNTFKTTTDLRENNFIALDVLVTAF